MRNTIIISTDDPGRLGIRRLAETLALPLDARMVDHQYVPTDDEFVIAIINFAAMFVHPHVQLVEENRAPTVENWIGIYPHSPGFLGALTPVDPAEVRSQGTGRVLYCSNGEGYEERLEAIRSRIPEVERPDRWPIMPHLGDYDLVLGNAGITMLDAWAVGVPFVAVDRGQPPERWRAQHMGYDYVTAGEDIHAERQWSEPKKWGLPTVVDSLSLLRDRPR